MIVCAHGDVADYCKEHDMLIVETHVGNLIDYNGVSRVLVTDQDIPEVEYCFLKGKLMARGVELVSTRHKDRQSLSEYMTYVTNQKSGKKSGGRYKFGFQNIDGEVKLMDSCRPILKRIFELRESGYTYRRIIEDERVHYPDGRKLNISTIQIILQNREIYEKEGL